MLLERGTSSLYHIIRKRRGSSPFTFEEKVSIALQLSLGLQVPPPARLSCLESLLVVTKTKCLCASALLTLCAVPSRNARHCTRRPEDTERALF